MRLNRLAGNDPSGGHGEALGHGGVGHRDIFGEQGKEEGLVLVGEVGRSSVAVRSGLGRAVLVEVFSEAEDGSRGDVEASGEGGGALRGERKGDSVAQVGGERSRHRASYETATILSRLGVTPFVD